MITGFNTDIEYNGVTYHVQTEDKGVETPLILSLVYDRGTILASKRSPYNDLLTERFDEKELAERLNKQHKLICAAIKAGRIDDLKRMTMKESALKREGLIAQKEVKKIVTGKTGPLPKLETVRAPINPRSDADIIPPPAPENFTLPVADGGVFEIPADMLDEIIIEEVEIIEEEVLLPVEAVEIIKDFSDDFSPEPDKLAIELLNAPTFKSGERKTLSIMLYRGREQTGIPGAHVMVKVLGTSFRPLIFHAKTDSNGVAIVHMQLPNFKTGRAAILIKALHDSQEIELRRTIVHG